VGRKALRVLPITLAERSLLPLKLAPHCDEGKRADCQAHEQGQDPQVPLDLLLERGDDADYRGDGADDSLEGEFNVVGRALRSRQLIP